MLYYRVKKEYDQTQKLIWKRQKHAWYQDGILIQNELYTARELAPYGNINENMFDIIRIPKNKICWFFGARYEMEE